MDIWELGLQIIESKLTRHSFETWFRSTKLHSFDEATGTIRIGVQSQFFADWLKTHFLDLIYESMQNVTGKKDINIEFVVCEDLQKEEETSRGFVIKRKRTSNLNPKYTFSSFVVGKSNQFAHAATKMVAEAPGKVYNPLFIYSGVGLGKTHLLHAIGNYLAENKPHIRVLYVSSEQFTNEVIQAILNDRTVELRSKYRNDIDVLLMDDIQFIAGKERTIEEFFHTFNTLYEAHKQIVITSDRFPKDIKNIDERLRSRFEWGLLADIQPPDLETRIAIVKKKAAGEFPNLYFPDDVALFLAENIRTNVRELEGALIRLGAFASLTGQELSVEMAQRIFKDVIRHKEEKVTVDKIQKIVASYFNIKVSDLRSKKRTKGLVLPRQIAMYLCRDLLKMSFPEIGKIFGGKDHSTVIYACRIVEKEKDNKMKDMLEDIIKRIKEGR